MNDYVRGASEALNWVEAVLADIEPEKDPLDQLKKSRLGSSCGGAQISEKAPQLQPRNAQPEPSITVIPRGGNENPLQEPARLTKKSQLERGASVFVRQ